VAFCSFLFGYTTLIGWAFYGEQALEYLVGARATRLYRWVYCLLIPFGAIARPTVVWAWGDLMNALQVFPNMIGLIGLSGLAAMYATRKGLGGPHPGPD
jgi:AGCS family alanine or glycine:cation symporter